MEKHQFELYNVDTETIEAVQSMTSAEAEACNGKYFHDGEPRRWMPVQIPKPKRNGAIVQHQQRVQIEPDGDCLWAI